jgi:hypothetical protein
MDVFVVCVLYIKDKKAKPGQKSRLQIRKRAKKKNPNPVEGMEYCVLSGRGLCDGPITGPEESYRLRCVGVCDTGTSRIRRSWPALGCSARETTTTCRLALVCTLPKVESVSNFVKL